MAPDQAPTAETLDGAANVEAWARVFADIEAHLAQVGPDMSEDDIARMTAWKPPADLGPIPEGLLEYGQALLMDLERATGALQQVIAANRQQARVADAVPPARDRGVAGYLDVQA